MYFTVIVTLFAGLTVAERLGLRVRGHTVEPSAVEQLIGRVAASRVLRSAPLSVISAGVPALMVFGSLWVAEVPRDFAIAAGVLAALTVAQMLRARAGPSLIVRGTIYAAAILSSYLLILYPRSADSPVQLATMCLVGLLALAVATYVRLAKRQEFSTTPTDYLVVFGLLALIAFGIVDTTSRGVVEFVACATVLLYGCEIAIGRDTPRWPVLHVSTLATLMILALRGVA
jgi:UDP-GlcNAc:undecaprenyl-phosphate GlcNAc-1-phosphate transferase